jgi:lipopolysaccharide transport system permease protein
VTEASASITERAAPLVRIRPSRGWSGLSLNLRELWQFRDLLIVLASRDVKLRYRQTLLGIAWVIFQPLLAAGIFTLVFGVIAKLPGGGVPYFLLAYTGQLAWTAFNSTFTKASSSLVQSAPLVSKVYFPRLILPLSTLLSTLLDFAIGGALLVVLMMIYRVVPGAAILLLPIWLLLALVLAIGLGLMAAALMVSYRDVQYLLPVLLPLLMYASPVAYSLSDALARLPDSLRPVLLLNPLSGLVEGFRWSLLGTAPPPLWTALYAAAFAIAALLVGAIVFKRMERRFADVI